jgi:outer membrane lipoprotein carrier protein
MRKIGIGVAIVLVTLLIALAVRGQVRRTEPAEAAAPARADTPASQQPVSQVDAPTDSAPVLTARPTAPVTQDPSQPAPAQRPVISDNVPSVAPDNEVDEDAQQTGANVLKRASAAYSRTKSMRAEFVQRRENALLNSTTISRGTLYQRDPDRFALKFSQPAGDLIVGDGKYFWIYYPSADRRQVIRAPAGEGAGAVDLQSQFIGDPLTRFTHFYHGTQQINGRNAHVITLTPRRDAGYKSLKVWIDAADYLVRRFVITEETGTVVEFQLSNLTANPSLGDDIFRFTPPAGATIIER